MRLERRRALVSGGELAFVDAGEGLPVVLLHGFPTSADLWRQEVLLLGSRMRVLAPDLLGYGESDRPAGADLSVVAQARNVGELLDRLGVDGCAVVGHDIGGGVAQLLALEGRARALVLIDAVCFDAWPIEGVRRLQEATPEQETPRFVGDVVRLVWDLGVARKDRLDPDLVEATVATWTADPGAFFRAVRAIDGVGLAGREPDLARLDLPALVVWGEEDPFLPPALAERLGEVLPDALVALLPGCSHFVTLDAPETVGQILHEFLRLRYLGERHGHGPEGGPVPVFLHRPSDEELRRSGPDLEDE